MEENKEVVLENDGIEIQNTFNEDDINTLVEDGMVENLDEEEKEGIGADNFTMRQSKPGAGNRFYITRDRGGLSTCIQGKPTDAQCNVLSNCVGYACGRFNEIIGEMKYPNLNCNAENFIERAKNYGLSISPVPVEGGIMVWQKGTLNSGDGAGHVAIVEKLNGDGSIYTSESNYGGSAFWNSTRSNINGRWGMGANYTFRGCIINPGISNNNTTASNKSIEEVAREVISGRWGNGDTRKANLINAGYNYDEVQAKVNELLSGNKPVSKSVEEVAREVISGKWGNGSDRKSRLENAGYNYSEIQNKVNELLGNNNPSETYIVRSGDTLSGIASKYGMSWQTLYAKNRAIIGANPNIIREGQRLIIR